VARSLYLCLQVIGWIGCPITLSAAPNISKLSVHGLQLGQPVEITVDGQELLPEPRVVLPVPILEQRVLEGGRSNRIVVRITVSSAVSPGIYQLRIANAKGISNPVAIGIDDLPSRLFTENVTALPVSLNGSLTGRQVLKTTFSGKKDQPLVVDLESRRLGSKLRPVIRVNDSHGRQLAWGQTSQFLAGDVRLEVRLPDDGRYTVELHDLLYRGAAPGHFRLKLGELRYVDLVHPLGVQRGQTAMLRLTSTNISPVTLVEYTAPQDSHDRNRPAILPPIVSLTGGRPRLVLSDHPEIVEADVAAGQLQEVGLPPVAINGRLLNKGEEDQFSFKVKPGSKLRFDVLADRAGSPLDAVLVIRDKQGNELATNDDRPTMSDSGLDFTVPGKLDHVVVAIRDLLGRGGDVYLYRISVRDLAAPDFDLTVNTDRLNIPGGATQVLQLQINRDGFKGPINLYVEGLPKSVQIAGTQIPGEATRGLLTLSAPEIAAIHGTVRIIARGGDPPIVRIAKLPPTSVTSFQPWLRDRFAVAVTESGPLGIAWSGEGSSPALLLGGKLTTGVSIARSVGTDGAAKSGLVRLRLMTTQVMPKKTIKENNLDKQVDDLDRALRLDSQPMLEAGAHNARLAVLVPPDLPQREWGLVLQAELLSPDKKSVVASVTTPVRYLMARKPFRIELTGGKDLRAKTGTGDTDTLRGKIHREEGFDEPVTVTLIGLPQGYDPPQLVVPADKTEFSLPVSFAFGAKPGELKQVTLVGTFTRDPQKPSLVVQSNQIALGVITVVSGEKPAAEKPHLIFEDEEKFVSYLTKGGGQIDLSQEKYSGQVSIKVTPDQRFHEKVPNLDLTIRENPGPGEYRYLRFAWKKNGGTSICLQINHDGNWGPGGSGKKGAKFRYHAGPGGECYGASIKLDDTLPDEFTLVTRDLFTDFGEFNFTGIALSPVDGEYGLFDHLYLGRSQTDFEMTEKR